MGLQTELGWWGVGWEGLGGRLGGREARGGWRLGGGERQQTKVPEGFLFKRKLRSGYSLRILLLL